jgi:hypothetical protein
MRPHDDATSNRLMRDRDDIVNSEGVMRIVSHAFGKLGSSLAVSLVLVVAGFAAPCASQPGASYPRWVATGSLNVPRHGHTATLLANGKVLVAGGYSDDAVASAVDSAEVYDPKTGTWSFTGSMAEPRTSHTATLLADGRVLVVGGFNGEKDNVTAELYDPSTGAWARTGNPTRAQYGHTATLLQSGKVLVAGDGQGICELFDPATGTWARTGDLGTPRYAHTATLLRDGRVLVTGGTNDPDLLSPFNSAEFYDPVAAKWTPAPSLIAARLLHTATLAPDGRVLVTSYANSSELFNPVTGEWSLTGGLNSTRIGNSATLLLDGSVLVAGGFPPPLGRPPLPLSSAESYDFTTGKWSYAGDLSVGRIDHTATLLANGKVLVVGGQREVVPPAYRSLASVDLYEPFAPPTNTSFRVTALFSDQAGLYQLIQLTELYGQNNQQHVAGLTLTSKSRSGVIKRFTFPKDLPSADTAFRSVLIKTASLSLPESYFDYVVPDGFVPTEAGGFVGIEDPLYPGNYLAVMYVSNLPTDGHSALRSTGVEAYGLFQSFNSPVFHVTTGVDPVIEYYNAALDHYFITASLPDIEALDSGRFAGWLRTGASFPAWISTYVDPLGAKGTGPPPGLQPVCRIYIPPPYGDSHFFSASTAECSASLARFPHLLFESASVFFAVLPNAASGACAATLVPVYRVWNARADSNHRYTTSKSVRDQMIAKGYVAEGYGPDGVAMCAGGND